MLGMRCSLLLALQVLWLASGSLGQRSSFSLQAAVDELHRREADKFPLNAPPQQRYFGGPMGGGGGAADYWDDDSLIPRPVHTSGNLRNRQRLNKALAKYLEHGNYETEHGGPVAMTLGPFGGYEFDEDSNSLLPNYPVEKKSSSHFRDHDNQFESGSPSSFRERESQVATIGGDHSGLTDQFLKEIEESQEHEREEHFKQALRQLWEKYQQQENEVDGDLFEEKKRMRMPPYYMLMQKKRSYPVLPWLPYSERKKRFPVAKRSTNRSTQDNINFSKTDEKVAKELSELFGPMDNEDKQKRSTDLQKKASTTNSPDTASTAMTDMRLEQPTKHTNTSDQVVTKSALVIDSIDHHYAGHNGHLQKEHKHRKRSDHSHESHEEDEESDEHDDHEEEEEDEEEHEEIEEEDEDESKKKRDTTLKKHSNKEVVRPPSNLAATSRKKKSIEWSKYFGLDRKKKAIASTSKLGLFLKKRSTADKDPNSEDKEKKKRDIDPEALESMDKKLQSIEDFIINKTIKYTGAHEGVSSPEKVRRLKDYVLARLATAYSLEKMRRALEKFRQSVGNENHWLHNVIEPDTSLDDLDILDNQKRLSVKKEKALVHDMQLSDNSEKTKEVNSNAMMSATSSGHKQHPEESVEEEDDMRKKKKKRNGYLRYPEVPNDLGDLDEDLGAGRYESLNDAYLGNKNYIIGSNQCPLIESMAERCRGVDLLSGDINQELLPICGVHQICYVCGISQVACDYQYLDEADTICGNNNDCQAAARSVLMILRGTPGPQLGPRECLKNPCLYSAMREIGL